MLQRGERDTRYDESANRKEKKHRSPRSIIRTSRGYSWVAELPFDVMRYTAQANTHIVYHIIPRHRSTYLHKSHSKCLRVRRAWFSTRFPDRLECAKGESAPTPLRLIDTFGTSPIVYFPWVINLCHWKIWRLIF